MRPLSGGLMARAIWKGTLNLGLVQVPTGLYSAQRSNELKFTMLDRKNFSPVGYQRVNKANGKPVAWEDIVRGYEHDDNEYVVLTDDDFREANVEATQSVDIIEFVKGAAINPIFFDQPYYVAPTKAGQKAYALLRDTLADTGYVGISKVVIHTRQHLAALMPIGKVLMLMLLRFADEIRDPAELALPEKAERVSSKEREMAEKLIEGMHAEWKPEKYHDSYREDLMSLIQSRIKEGKTNTIAEKSAKKPKQPRGKVIDLTEMLKRSLESQHGHKAPRKKAVTKRKSKPGTLRKSA